MNEKALDIISKLGPVITIVALFIGYIIWVGQRKYEAKREFYRNIKISASNILLIWKVFSFIEFRLKSTDKNDRMLFKYPGLAKAFFKINKSEVKLLDKNFNESLDALKSINVDLFFRLSNNYRDFKESIDQILIPLINEEALSEDEQEKILVPLLEETLKELEEFIQELISYLPRSEKKKIKFHFEEHKEKIANSKDDIAVPDFIISFINSSSLFKEDITSEEFTMFFGNPFVKKLISKVNVGFFIKILGATPINIIRSMFKASQKDADFFKKIDGKINMIDIILKFELDDEDEKYLKDNLTFYKLLIGFLNKTERKVDFAFKRVLLRINNGSINVKEKLNEAKLEIVMEQAAAKIREEVLNEKK